VFFRGWRAERVLGAGLCNFSFCMPEGLDCKYMLLKIPLNHFYQTVFLVYTLFLFFFLSECNLSDLWIPEAMEVLLLSCPSFMVRQIFFVFLLV
jgi:hypothetical protein